jgi:hypothetical protein
MRCSFINGRAEPEAVLLGQKKGSPITRDSGKARSQWLRFAQRTVITCRSLSFPRWPGLAPAVSSGVSAHFYNSAVGPCTSCASPSPVRAQRREIGFESLESPHKSSGDHDRRVATSAARSNSATRASISSTHSAARSFTAAGTFGSVRSLSAIGAAAPVACCIRATD